MAMSRADADTLREQALSLSGPYRYLTHDLNSIRDVDDAYTSNGELERAKAAIDHVSEAWTEAMERVRECRQAIGDPEVSE